MAIISKSFVHSATSALSRDEKAQYGKQLKSLSNPALSKGAIIGALRSIITSVLPNLHSGSKKKLSSLIEHKIKKIESEATKATAKPKKHKNSSSGKHRKAEKVAGKVKKHHEESSKKAHQDVEKKSAPLQEKEIPKQPKHTPVFCPVKKIEIEKIIEKAREEYRKFATKSAFLIGQSPTCNAFLRNEEVVVGKIRATTSYQVKIANFDIDQRNTEMKYRFRAVYNAVNGGVRQISGEIVPIDTKDIITELEYQLENNVFPAISARYMRGGQGPSSALNRSLVEALSEMVINIASIEFRAQTDAVEFAFRSRELELQRLALRL